MKKIICLLVALLMALSVFAACTPKEDNRKVLRVAMECDYAPYNWTQTTDENGAVPIKDTNEFAYGYDVMMAKLLADKLDYRLEIVKRAWEGLTPALLAGEIDCVIAGESMTSERMENVDFTEPYYYASIVVLVKNDSEFADAKGLADLKGASATSQTSTVWYDKFLPQIPEVKKGASSGKVPPMVESLKAGKFDVLVVDMPAAMAITASNSDLKILDFSETDDGFKETQEDVNIGVSVKKGNAELVEELNSVLKTLTVEDFERMMKEAIELSAE